MLWTIVVILAMLWLLGALGTVSIPGLSGNAVHVLLAIVIIIIVVIQLLQGRRLWRPSADRRFVRARYADTPGLRRGYAWRVASRPDTAEARAAIWIRDNSKGSRPRSPALAISRERCGILNGCHVSIPWADAPPRE